MKFFLYYILKILSQVILKKYNPDVIGVTGSVGKTTTKIAIYTVLKDGFNCRVSQKSYNTETGVPLTIIGSDNPGKNIFSWFLIFLKALSLIISKTKNYPKILILEMAADHPGDIKYLVNFTKPKIGVLTSVGPTHLEFFGSTKNVAKEKENIITSLPKEGTAIVNTDQKILADIARKTNARLITYGLETGQLTAGKIKQNFNQGGLSFEFRYHNSSSTVEISGALGNPVIYSLLAAGAVGIAYNMKLNEIAKRLEFLEPMPGRLYLMPGIKYTKIIDDSYNSSPLAAEAALNILSQLKCTGSKFAVLGDMLELGGYTKKAHTQTGQLVAKLAIDYLITVGQRSQDTAQAAQDYGMNQDRIFSFDTSANAGRFLQDRIKEGDLILIKGSAAMAMEKITKELMAQPEQASQLLVRQK